MAEIAVQRFFETPLVQATLPDAGLTAAIRTEADSAGQLTALGVIVGELAERITTDVSRPVHPRYRWTTAAQVVRCEAGEDRPLRVGPGAFWTALVNLGPSDGTVILDDPRGAMLTAGVPGMAFAPPGEPPAPMLEHVRVVPAALVMIPSYIRHGIAAHEAEEQVWAIVDLVARRV